MPVGFDGVIDEHFLRRYRALLDAEEVAFDELAHAFEDGDREHFAADLEAWQAAVGRKSAFLRRMGVEPEGVPAA
jgi:hypothetical protein